MVGAADLVFAAGRKSSVPGGKSGGLVLVHWYMRLWGDPGHRSGLAWAPMCPDLWWPCGCRVDLQSPAGLPREGSTSAHRDLHVIKRGTQAQLS